MKTELIITVAMIGLATSHSNAADVFGEKLLLAAGETSDVGILQYDSQERFVALDFNENKYIFEYIPGVCTENIGKPFSYDVRMRVLSAYSAYEEANIYYKLGENGFAKEAWRVSGSGYHEHLIFGYNAGGQMTSFEYLDGSTYSAEVTYANGDIAKIIYTDEVDVDPAPDTPIGRNISRSLDESDCTVMTVSYGDTPIENKGCIMLFDEMFGFELGEVGYAYFAGILGKATRHLPAQMNWDDGWALKHSWQTNAEGYVTHYSNSEVEPDGGGEYSGSSYDFFWMPRNTYPAIRVGVRADMANQAVVEWNRISDAKEYKLTVYKEDELFDVWFADNNGNVYQAEPDEPSFPSTKSASGNGTTISVNIGEIDEDAAYSYQLLASDGSGNPIGAWYGNFTASSSGINDIIYDGKQRSTKYYNLNGIEVDCANAPPDVYIISDGIRTRKVIIR